MSEPVTLYRDGDEVIVTAPSEVRRMLADGWSLTDDYVPFAFREQEPEPEQVPDVVPVKRGRPRKAKQ
jgi:hypothetical protein